MSDFFDARRWWLLVRKQAYEKRKIYLYGTLTLVSVMAAWYFWFMIENRENFFYHHDQFMVYFVGLGVAGVLFASYIFSDTATKESGISYFTLPASIFEKWLCGFFYTMIVVPVLYTIIFYALTIATVQYSNHYRSTHWEIINAELYELQKEEPDTQIPLYVPSTVIKIWNYDKEATDFGYRLSDYDEEERYINKREEFYMAFFAAMLVQSFFAMGSVLAGRLSLIKTAVILTVLGLIMLAFVGVLKIVFDVTPPAETITKNDVDFYYTLPDWIMMVDLVFLFSVPLPFFWFITYLGLKEKQV